MVKLTLEFKSADEAIVALGKLVGITKVSAAPAAIVQSAPSGAEVTAAPAAAEPRTRKARADKGQPRGPYKNAVPEKAPAEGDKPQPSGVLPAPAPAAAAPVKATLAEVQAALNELYETKGHDVSLQVLSRFGVDRAKNLLPEAWGEFIAKARAVIAGEAP